MEVECQTRLDGSLVRDSPEALCLALDMNKTLYPLISTSFSQEGRYTSNMTEKLLTGMSAADVNMGESFQDYS